MTQPMTLTRQPMPAATEPLTGSESVIVIQNGKPRQISARKFVDQLAPRLKAEVVTSTVGATATFKTAFKQILDIVPQSTWISGQRCEAVIIRSTATTATFSGMITQATLLANTAPYKVAPNGTAVKALVLGY